MRYVFRALVCVLVLGCCIDARAEEGGSSWWPFGRDKESEETAPPTGVPELGATTGTPSAADAAILGAVPTTTSPTTQPALPDVGPTAGAKESEEKWMLDSDRGKVSWPRFSMPKMGKPKLPRPQLRGKSPAPTAQAEDAKRNTWMDKPAEPKPSATQAMSNGARRMGDSTKRAWHKTVDALTPGSDEKDSSPRVASRDEKPSLWQRMWGAEEPKDDGPQTMTEWMAQDRLVP